MAVKSYILNYMWTAANFIIEARMRPYDRRLRTVALHVPNFNMFLTLPKFE